MGMRVALLTATRGDGGQNEIGPELFDAIGVLRTEELLAAHRWDGAEQYFTRAVDFGFSFSPQETLQKWGHDEILGDFVRMLRTIRPDVMVTLPPIGHRRRTAPHGVGHAQLRGVHRGGGSGEVPGAAARRACAPWQVKKLYQPGGGGFGRFGGPGGPADLGGRGRGRGGPPAPAGRGGLRRDSLRRRRSWR